MFEEAKHFQLPEHPFTRNKVLEDIGHLFESDSLPISGVRHRPRKKGETRICIFIVISTLTQMILTCLYTFDVFIKMLWCSLFRDGLFPAKVRKWRPKSIPKVDILIAAATTVG